MSDIFKLLSRSTKLQRQGASNSSAQTVLPSAGIPSKPQTLAAPNDQVTASDQSKRGKKRKRKAAQVGIEYELPSVGLLDIQGSNGSKYTVKDAERGGKAVGEQTNLSGEGHQSLSFEARKRILESHKLKVTLMDDEVEQRLSRKSKKRKQEKQKTPKTSKTRRALYPDPLLDFADLRSRYSISKRLADNIESQGYKKPTEVQLGTVPILLGSPEDAILRDGGEELPQEGQTIDLLTIAPTGSGKTLAFLIPVIQRLISQNHGDKEQDDKPAHVKAIVLAPTHELVDQIVNEGKKLTQGTGVKVSAMQKGAQVGQESSAQTTAAVGSTIKTDILVSTPLVLLNSLQTEEDTMSPLPSIKFLVLDEADVLLDTLFREQTMGIWQTCVDPDLQTSLWSATIGSSIEALTQQTLTQRREDLGLDAASRRTIRLVAGLKDSALPTVSHKLVYAGSEQGKLLAIRQLLHPTSATDTEIASLRPPFIVFTQTISRATALHSELLYDIPVEAGGSSRIAVLHSGLSDTSRSSIMAGFRKGEIWVMITTDLLARGIDFRGVNGIVNYDIPNTSAAYVHRAGRTGRAGREGGVAVTLYTKEDIPYVKNIANVIAASEKVHGRTNSSTNIQQWLLDALPDVSKKARKELKQKGVAARRTETDGSKSKEARRATISTKTGFDKQRENRKKDAIASTKKQVITEDVDTASDGDEGWEGLD